MVPETPAKSNKPVQLADNEVSIEAEPQAIVDEVDEDTVGSKGVGETFLEASKSEGIGDDPEKLHGKNAEVKDMCRLHVVFVLDQGFDQQ